MIAKIRCRSSSGGASHATKAQCWKKRHEPLPAAAYLPKLTPRFTARGGSRWRASCGIGRAIPGEFRPSAVLLGGGGAARGLAPYRITPWSPRVAPPAFSANKLRSQITHFFAHLHPPRRRSPNLGFLISPSKAFVAHAAPERSPRPSIITLFGDFDSDGIGDSRWRPRKMRRAKRLSSRKRTTCLIKTS